MGDLAVMAALDLAAMVAMPLIIVVAIRKQPAPRYLFSPKAEHLLFVLKIFISEAVFVLLGFPLVVDLLVGERNFSDMRNNSHVPNWALPVGYAWGGIIVVAIVVMFVSDMYRSYKGAKSPHVEQ
jgi:purine-cytosine permease-like protein